MCLAGGLPSFHITHWQPVDNVRSPHYPGWWQSESGEIQPTLWWSIPLVPPAPEQPGSPWVGESTVTNKEDHR